MQLPFFDLTSSARYLADLLKEAEPPFASLALVGSHAVELAAELRVILPGTPIAPDESPADVVVSFDAIHLLPQNERTEYVKRIASRASREVIIACPLGTELQKTICRSLEKLAREQKILLNELTDALAFGLPTPTDAASWAHGCPDIDLFYAGDVAFFQEQTTRFLWQSKLSPLRRRLQRLTSANAPSAVEADLPPETVPMRRHRRLYLLIRKR